MDVQLRSLLDVVRDFVMTAAWVRLDVSLDCVVWAVIPAELDVTCACVKQTSIVYAGSETIVIIVSN